VLVKSWGPPDLVAEPAYNTAAVRIFPWAGVPEPAWGGAWVAVDPGETVTPHAHDEKEMFFIVEGTGVMRIGAEQREVGFGDTIFITPDVQHDLTNTGDSRLLFLGIWWDGRGSAADPTQNASP
jgi:mannose-6-phosphate isomerase-like protein (cupin superfamily)